MKKILFIMTVLALGLTACNVIEIVNPEEVTPEVTPESTTPAPVCYFTLPATIGDEPSTKAVTLTDDTATTSFEASDKIYVFIEGQGDNAGKLAFGFDMANTCMATMTLDNINGATCDLSGAMTFYYLYGGNPTAFTPLENDIVHLFYNAEVTIPEVDVPSFNYAWQNGNKEGYTDPLGYGYPDDYLWGASNYDYAAAKMVLTAATGNTSTGFTLEMKQYDDPTKTNVSFKNLQSMFRQRLSFVQGPSGQGSTDPTISSITIDTAGGNCVIIYYPFGNGPIPGVYVYNYNEFENPSLTDGDLFFAMMFNDVNKDEAIVITAEDTNGNIYSCTKNAPASGFRNGKYYHGSATLTWVGHKVNLSSIDVSGLPEEYGYKYYTVSDGDILTGTMPFNCNINVPANATVTLAGMTHNAGEYYSGIQCLGTAHIILADGTDNDLTAGDAHAYAGILLDSFDEATLTISGTGTLYASGGIMAGIGGLYKQNHIVINGGTITVTGGFSSAGIGASDMCDTGNITINGGNITATGGYSAPGIGAGNNSTCGTITFNGGTTVATGGDNGGYTYYGIGAGFSFSSCGDIHFNNGASGCSVRANGAINTSSDVYFDNVLINNMSLLWEDPFIYPIP